MSEIDESSDYTSDIDEMMADEEKAGISWFSTKRLREVQKFRTDDASLPRSG